MPNDKLFHIIQINTSFPAFVLRLVHMRGGPALLKCRAIAILNTSIQIEGLLLIVDFTCLLPSTYMKL